MPQDKPDPDGHAFDAATMTSSSEAAPTHLRHPVEPIDPSTGPPLESTLPRYERLEALGRGGMGEVWACRDARVGRLVAMKQVLAQRKVGADSLARFLREARVQGQLEHPAIVPLYDLGIHDGTPFFTMRRVAGKTLAEILSALVAGDKHMA